MTDLSLPTPAEIASLPAADLISIWNAFAPTAGQNPVRKFETRAAGVTRLTKLAAELRAKGVTEPSAPVVFPVIARPEGWDVVDTTSDDPKAVAPAKPKAPAPKPAPKVAPKAVAKKAPAKPAAPGYPGDRVDQVSRSARCRELIAEGLDNDAIWAILKVEEKLADDKRNYIKGYAAGQRRYLAGLKAGA